MKKPRAKPGKSSPQTEFSFALQPQRTLPLSERNRYCPVYFPKSGGELKQLASVLGPVLEKTGWEIRISAAGKESFLELIDRRNGGASRRLSPDEIVAWQAILPELMGDRSVLKVGFKD
jgi:hypothetical protein